MAVSYAYLDRRPGLRAADRADRTRRHQAGVTQEPADAEGGHLGELDRQTQEPIGGRLAATVVREI
jgi:hypothetical protein